MSALVSVCVDVFLCVCLCMPVYLTVARPLSFMVPICHCQHCDSLPFTCLYLLMILLHFVLISFCSPVTSPLPKIYPFHRYLIFQRLIFTYLNLSFFSLSFLVCLSPFHSLSNVISLLSHHSKTSLHSAKPLFPLFLRVTYLASTHVDFYPREKSR